ncbi:uncharacterized protein LOC135216668 [Macrobrachium nipponense]|uniref:uncharacterized protein LOC135216668 n=1 Tax=Macrobrachium nipponense TaxID=159736 RepID=UPI0030C874A6
MILQVFTLSIIWTSSISSVSGNEYEYSNEVDTDALGPYENMVAATNAILPELADVFDKISYDKRLNIDPFSPEGIRDAIMAFLPISRSVLLAAAQAEGRRVTQDDLDRLATVENELPLAFDYISSLKSLRHYSPGSGPALYHTKDDVGTVPSAAKTVNVSPEKLQTSHRVAPLASADATAPKGYEPTHEFHRIPSDRKVASPQTQRPSSSSTRPSGRNTASNLNPAPSNGNVFFGKSAVELLPTFNARVLRGATEPESQEPLKPPGSSTFIKMPFSQAVFIRHS